MNLNLLALLFNFFVLTVIGVAFTVALHNEPVATMVGLGALIAILAATLRDRSSR